MSAQILGVMVGGLIGIISGLMTTLVLTVTERNRRTRSIRAIAAAEITAIKEKAERYGNEKSTKEELGASTPMLTSIASELGFLATHEVIALRRTITLDMELRKSGNKDKVQPIISACEDALKLLSVET